MTSLVMRRTTLLAALAASLAGAGAASAQEGKEVPIDFTNDRTKASPPTVIEPLYGCAAAIAVSGGVRNAEVRAYVNGALQGRAVVQYPWETEIALGAALVPGDVVTATQVVDSVETGPSRDAVVRDHRVDFPAGLPRSRIHPDLVYQCGRVIADHGHLPGSNVSVFRGGSPAGTFGTSTDWTNLWPSGPVFARGEKFETQYEICGDGSPISEPVFSVDQPANIPPPYINPDVYDGQEIFNVERMLYGAITHVDINGSNAASLATAIDWVPIDAVRAIGRPLRQGDSLSATQELCTAGPPSVVVTVQPCADLPAPRIAAPAIGDTVVTVTQSQPGARIVVIDGSNQEIGDGAAPTVNLYRPIQPGETIRVAQMFDGCVNNRAYEIPVLCNPWDVVADRSLPVDAPLGRLDYDEGTIVLGRDTTRVAATVRFPSASGKEVAPGGPKPIVFIMHGNHGTHRPSSGDDVCGGAGLPEAPSFRGYDYLLDALARHGYIAVSINANDLNCLRGRIPERSQLFHAHIELWQRAADAANPSPPLGGLFAGRVDLGNTVLFGHSRGGDAAVMAAATNGTGATIRGVVAIGPTDAGTALRDIPLFVVAPANDLDVVDNAGIAIHDRASGGGGWFRSFVYIHDANHNFFNSEWRFHDFCAVGGARMARADQEGFLRALGLEFSDTVIGRSSRFRDIARDQLRVAGLRSEMAFWSYERGDDAVVDDYQDGDPARNLLGEPVNESGHNRFEERTFSWFDPAALNTSFLHETQGGLLGWDRPASFTSAIRQGAFTQPLFDVITLRIAQVGAAGVTPTAPLAAEVTARDRGGLSGSVVMSDAGRVPAFYTRDAWDAADPRCGPIPLTEEKTVMTSVRVPKACFLSGGKPIEGDDLAEIGIASGQVAEALIGIDNLGFSR